MADSVFAVNQLICQTLLDLLDSVLPNERKAVQDRGVLGGACADGAEIGPAASVRVVFRSVLGTTGAAYRSLATGRCVCPRTGRVARRTSETSCACFGGTRWSAFSVFLFLKMNF
jgi:hypothetical protein